MSDKTARDLASDIIVLLTVGANLDNSTEFATEVFEQVVNDDVDDAVELLLGITAFLGAMAEGLNVDLKASIEDLALNFALDPEEALRGIPTTGE